MSPKRIPRYSVRNGIVFTQNSVLEAVSGELILTHQNQKYIIPVGQLHCIIIGDDVWINEKAVKLIASCQVSIIYVKGLGYMSAVSNTTMWDAKAPLIENQARIFSNSEIRIKAAKFLLHYRFDKYPPKNINTIKSFMGWEGSCMKKYYYRVMKENGIDWNGRNIDIPWSEQDSINKYISISNSMLYGIVHCGILSLGASPSLGILHSGNGNSFVYDISDAMKIKHSIPIAVEMEKSNLEYGLERKFVYSSLAKRDVFSETVNLIKDVLN